MEEKLLLQPCGLILMQKDNATGYYSGVNFMVQKQVFTPNSLLHSLRPEVYNRLINTTLVILNALPTIFQAFIIRIPRGLSIAGHSLGIPFLLSLPLPVLHTLILETLDIKMSRFSAFKHLLYFC